MARDYKNRSSRKGGTGGSRLAGILMFLAGAVTGLCAAIIVYLVNGVPDFGSITNQRLDQQRPSAPTTDKPAGSQEKTDSTERRSAAPTPKFDFYTILPEMEVSVPEWESETEVAPSADAGESAAAPQPTDNSERYILQIGSFRQPDEAERVKAQLALLGIETEIQRVVIDGGDVWHRVRAGPYRSSGTLNQTRQRLIENDIDFMLLKLKQDSG